MISDDIALSQMMFQEVQQYDDLEAWTQSLSIATFRYLPADLAAEADVHRDYLNSLNTEILGRINHDGEVFISNAVVNGVYLLRACIVNFRTSIDDVAAVPRVVSRIGRETDREIRHTDS